jgi:Domain of unknown function (DUF4386)
MTTITRGPPVPSTAGGAPIDRTTRSLRAASLIAGTGILLLAVLAVFGNFMAVGALVTRGDAAKTARDILASEGLFRWGVASLILVAVLDIVVARALLTVFQPVNRSVSAMAAWFRVAYAVVFLVGIAQLVVALGLLGDPTQALRAIDTYTAVWNAALVLFAVHLLLIGHLAYRSGFVPRVVGILLVVAGLGYLTDGFGAVLISGYSLNIAQFTFVGEVVLIVWLLVKGVRMTSASAAPSIIPQTPDATDPGSTDRSARRQS